MSRGPLSGFTTLSFGAGRVNGRAAAPTPIEYNDVGLAQDRSKGLASVLQELDRGYVNFLQNLGRCLWHPEMNVSGVRVF